MSYIVGGQRAVGVLSTLIYLSYSKLLRTVIDIFTYSMLHIPDGSVLVWFSDGNIKYLHWKHSVCCGSMLLFPSSLHTGPPFIPLIETVSEQKWLVKYLHMKANQIKQNDIYRLHSLQLRESADLDYGHAFGLYSRFIH